jgi:putative transposon-encoded protein
MVDDIKKIRGSIALKEIKFDRVLKKKVSKHSETSSKIYLPKDLEGKEVYVVWKEKD